LVWRYRVSRGEEGDAEPPIVEWTEDPAALTLRETRLIAVELWARLSSGEEAAWIGIVEPLR
jgi:hypothetical protein